MELNELTSKIIGAAISVHKELGPGLLESVYNACLSIELKNCGIEVKTEVPLPVTYKGQRVSEEGFRLDMVVEDRVIVELKSVEAIQPVHQKQLLTYLRLARKPLGLLINFNGPSIRDGICRVINSETREPDKSSDGRL